MTIQIHSLTSALARTQRLTTRGMVHWTGGILSLNATPRVVEKFVQRYGVDADPTVERRQQRQGLARTRLTLWPEAEGVGFVLQATEGTGAVHELERLADARTSWGRICMRHYELCRLPRRGDAPRWTWRLPLDVYRELLAHGERLARRPHPGAAQHFLDAQMQRPGFNGVRTQQRELIRIMQTAAKHAGRKPLAVPKVVPWVRGATFRRCEPLDAWLLTERTRQALVHVRDSSPVPSPDDAEA